MKRSIFFALLTFIVACIDTEIVPVEENDESFLQDAVYSNVVTLEDARKELEAFLCDDSFSLSKSGTEFGSKKIADGFALRLGNKSLSKSTADSAEAQIYVFNFEEDGGFALMSSTRDTPPIFAIIDGGNLDTTQENDNPGFAIFMANLEAKLLNGELKYKADSVLQGVVISLSKQNTPSKTKEWSAYSAPKEKKFYKPKNGLCPYWKQGYPYNWYCPDDTIHVPVTSKKTGTYTIKYERAPVGCVAVACGLLMSTYRYPNSYKGWTFHWDDMIKGKRDSTDVAWLLKKNWRSRKFGYGI